MCYSVKRLSGYLLTYTTKLIHHSSRPYYSDPKFRLTFTFRFGSKNSFYTCFQQKYG